MKGVGRLLAPSSTPGDSVLHADVAMNAKPQCLFDAQSHNIDALCEQGSRRACHQDCAWLSKGVIEPNLSPRSVSTSDLPVWHLSNQAVPRRSNDPTSGGSAASAGQAPCKLLLLLQGQKTDWSGPS
jgi:hypothetical protein